MAQLRSAHGEAIQSSSADRAPPLSKSFPWKRNSKSADKWNVQVHQIMVARKWPARGFDERVLGSRGCRLNLGFLAVTSCVGSACWRSPRQGINAHSGNRAHGNRSSRPASRWGLGVGNRDPSDWEFWARRLAGRWLAAALGDLVVACASRRPSWGRTRDRGVLLFPDAVRLDLHLLNCASIGRDCDRPDRHRRTRHTPNARPTRSAGLTIP